MNYYQKKCEGINHTIRPGDTLYRLSRIYGVSVSKIMDANPDVNIYNLKVGTVLCIPMEMKPDGKEPAAPMPEPERPGSMEIWQSGAGLDWMIIMPYKVQKGDNLNSILNDFDMDFETFASYNPGLMPIAVPEGETVYVKRRRIMVDGRKKE